MSTYTLSVVLLLVASRAYSIPTPPAVEIIDKEVTSNEIVAETVTEDIQADSNTGDASVFLSEPIDHATKLLIDLEEAVKKYLPAEDVDEIIPTTQEPHIYGSLDNIDEQLSVIQRQQNTVQNQMQSLIEQVNRVAANLESTITDLVSNRRYVTAAMLRSMLSYVRRVRISLERLQNRVQALQAVADTGSNSTGSSGSQPGMPGTQFFETIRVRLSRISEEIQSLMTRIQGSFIPQSLASSTTPSSNAVAAAA